MNYKIKILLGGLLLILLSIEISIIYFISFDENARVEQSRVHYINNTNNRVITNINDTIYLSIYNTYRNDEFFTITNKRVNITSFKNFISIDKHPFKNRINAFLWIPRIYDNEKQSFEIFARENIAKNYTIVELSNNNTLVNVTKRNYYSPITYWEPNNNTSSLGFDLLSHPSTDKYVIYNHSNPVLFESIQISNSSDNNIIITKASISNGDIIGHSMILISMLKLIEISISEFDQNVFDIVISDFTDNNTLIYKSSKYDINEISDVKNYYYLETDFNILERVWKLYLIYDNNILLNIQSNLTLILIIIFGIAISLLINLIIFGFIKLYIQLKKTRHARNEIEFQKNTSNKMIGYVNHEIRNPLNGIMGIIDLTLLEWKKCLFFDKSLFNTIIPSLKNILSLKHKNNIKNKINEIIILFQSYLDKYDNDKSPLYSNLKTAKNSCNLLAHIVNDVLDVRKLEEGRLDISIKNASLVSILDDIRRLIKPKLEEKPNLLFSIHNLDKIDKLLCDKYRVTQIIMNFLSNSIKFTSKGYIKLRILLKYDLDNNKYIRFEVIDTGRGIKNEYKPLLFKPFQQSNIEDSTRHGGIGLGLYLCKMLAERMRGNINFTSEYGQGATFRLDIPFLKISDE